MSTFNLLMATLELAAALWALQQWLRQKDNLALLFGMIILISIAFDAFTNGIGRFMGLGDPLETLIRVRMTFYYMTMPLLIAISVLYLGYAGVGWARNTKVTGAVIACAVLAGLYQVVAYWDMALYPSCVFDVVRYVLEVHPDQACRPEDAGLGEFALSPVVPISAMTLLLTTVALVWLTRFWWVALVLLASNLASAVVVQIPREGLMTYVSYPFDGVLGFLLCFVAIKLYARRDDLSPRAATVS